MSDERNLPTVLSRITEYLDSGGLWNPELADHAAVRDLILDARDEIDRLTDKLNWACLVRDITHAAAQSFARDRDRAERILAALREPSGRVFMAMFTSFHGTDRAEPLAWALRAAVAAAEQEVGRE